MARRSKSCPACLVTMLDGSGGGKPDNIKPLWAALLFNDLSLQWHVKEQTGNHQDSSEDLPEAPRAIVQRQGIKRLLMSCNTAAKACGLQSGLTLNAAYAICPSLLVDEYDERRQQRYIETLSLWAMRYSSWVTPVMPDTIMLEAGASLALFGGLDSLLAKIQEDAAGQGLNVAIGVAPTPRAARLFSRLHYETGELISVMRQDQLADRLGELPVSLLPLDTFTHKGLRQSGIRTFSQIIDLPASSLARRFGPGCTETIYKILGRVPDPCPAHELPERFCCDMDLPVEVPDTGALQFPLNRILHALGGYLRASDSGVKKLRIDLFHEKQAASQITLGFLEATANHPHLLRVATEKLAAEQLPAGVVAIRVVATETAAVSRSGRDLFSRSQSQAGTIEQAIDLLSARIGRDKIYRPRINNDHRPEHAWSTGQQQKAQANNPHSLSSDSVYLPTHPARPLWLLAEPRPAPENLSIQSSAERIEYGWWDRDDVRRDYYIARDHQGRWLWVFSERRYNDNTAQSKSGYFIHGYFA